MQSDELKLPEGFVPASDEQLAQEIGNEAYQHAKEWGWSEERALRWKEIWGSL